MAHNALQVANEIIRLGRSKQKVFTPMQLLKLVYIAHGWMLGIYSAPLIKDKIEAWKYGPVIPELYQSLKKYGSSPVFDNEIGAFWESKQAQFNEQEKAVIEYVTDAYGSRDGIELSRITHASNTPWSNTFTGGWGDEIPTDLIYNHYKQLYNSALSQQNAPTA